MPGCSWGPRPVPDFVRVLPEPFGVSASFGSLPFVVLNKVLELTARRLDGLYRDVVAIDIVDHQQDKWRRCRAFFDVAVDLEAREIWAREDQLFYGAGIPMKIQDDGPIAGE